MIQKAYKFEILPTTEQKVLLEQHFGSVRFVYNWALDLKKKAYEQDKKKLDCFYLVTALTKLKQEEQYKWLNDVFSQSLQMAIRNLDNAFTAFFRKQNDFPKFKSKHKSKASYQLPQKVRIDFENSQVFIPKLKNVKAVLHRKFDGKMKTCTVSKSKTNRYFISVLVEVNEDLPSKQVVAENATVGIDLGIKDFLITSDGKKVSNPKFLRQSEQRKNVLQRRLSRTQKDSKARERLRIKLATIHEKIANQRKDFLHKLTYQLTHENQVSTLVMEDLAVGNMLKNHCLSKSISDVSWSMFRSFLSYKCEWYGKNLVFIGRFEPSSKTCSVCGCTKKDLTLKDRTWKCENCGTEHDRDINAAINIKKFGLLKLGGKDFPSSINKASLSSVH